MPVTSGSTTIPRPGELLIKQRLSWKTWQLVVAVLVALVIGMVIGNSGGGTAGSGASGDKPAYTPPPPAGSSSQGLTSTTAAGSSTTVAPGSGSATTTPASSASTTPASTTAQTSGTLSVLLPQHSSQGNGTSATFTVGSAPWSLGWAYQCVPAPAPGAPFQIFVDPVGGPVATTAAVTGTTASGQSVTKLMSTGDQELQIKASPGCKWAVKVTGYG